MDATKTETSTAAATKARVQHHFAVLVSQGLTPNEAAVKAIALAQLEVHTPSAMPPEFPDLDKLQREGTHIFSSSTVPLDAWMGHLPEEVTRRSLCELALPGAHNAGASVLKCIPPQALIKYVGSELAGNPLVAMLAQPVASQAALCQSMCIKDLLSAGIRLLDLRVGSHEGELHICHTVICELTLVEALQQVAEFLHTQQSELVVLTIKRDWEQPDFDTADHWETVQAYAISILGDLLIADKSDMSLPLQDLCKAGRRALLLIEFPAPLELLCGVRLTNELLQKSWTPDMKTVDDLRSILVEWRNSGRTQPELGKLKLLEIALPGTPGSLAPPALEAFRSFLRNGEALHVGALMDFPDEATVRAMLAGNWAEMEI